MRGGRTAQTKITSIFKTAAKILKKCDEKSVPPPPSLFYSLKKFGRANN